MKIKAFIKSIPRGLVCTLLVLQIGCNGRGLSPSENHDASGERQSGSGPRASAALDNGDSHDTVGVESSSLATGDSPPNGTRPSELDLASNVILVEGDESLLAEKIKAAHGNVILVDFWATWCGPCVEQFPHTVSLHEKFRTKGLTVLSVSMDEPDSKDDVAAFLKSKNATFTSLLTPFGASEEFAKRFEIRGDLPFYKLYGRDGSLKHTFSDNPSGIPHCEPVENMHQRIEELLKESSK